MLRLLRKQRFISCRTRFIHIEKGKMRAKKHSTSMGCHISELNPWPSYIKDRISLWSELKAEHDMAIAVKDVIDITVTLQNGRRVCGTCWRTTPYDIAKKISPSLAEDAIIARVDNTLWDLDRPLERDCQLDLLKFDHPQGQQVFWCSSAYILGEVMERVYGGYLCHGAPTGHGFHYDMFLGARGISNHDLPYLEILYNSIVREKQPFERLEMKKEHLLKMFKYNRFKTEELLKMPTSTATIYKCGTLIELCKGPHILHTGKVKATKLINTSSTHSSDSVYGETLQRIYGVSFPDAKQLNEWKMGQAEAAKRDHRKIGQAQELFFFHDLSPGSCFFQPHGAHIYNTLVDFIRSEYKIRGFHEVITPNIYNSKLWQTSGHWQHYGDNMFTFDVEKQKFALKPMNCPGHCLMFNVRNRSWRELPLRIADFGVLHRNESAGGLTGLTRVRRFQQDDAHIFCSEHHIKDEVLSCLEFLKYIYTILGFTFNLSLSTRPKEYLGDVTTWDTAEKALADSLNTFGLNWTVNPHNGAFYGPKIDITIMDAMKRLHQTATIQLDFQLPTQFNMFYINEHGEKARPIIIHRAILGSVERMIAILCESYAGKWPLWLSPRQVIVIPVNSVFTEYAIQVKETLRKVDFMAEVDVDSSVTMNKKIRNAQQAQFNFIIVVGERERDAGTVNIRTRNNSIHGEIPIDEFIKKIQKSKENKDIDCENIF